jgi:hypothetical protein
MPTIYVKSIDGHQWFVGRHPLAEDEIGQYIHCATMWDGERNKQNALLYARALIWNGGEIKIQERKAVLVGHIMTVTEVV